MHARFTDGNRKNISILSPRRNAIGNKILRSGGIKMISCYNSKESILTLAITNKSCASVNSASRYLVLQFS